MPTPEEFELMRKQRNIYALKEIEGSSFEVTPDHAVSSYTEEFRIDKGRGFEGTSGLISEMLAQLGYNVRIHDTDLWFDNSKISGTLPFSMSMQQWRVDMPPRHTTDVSKDAIIPIILIVENGVLTTREWTNYNRKKYCS